MWRGEFAVLWDRHFYQILDLIKAFGIDELKAEEITAEAFSTLYVRMQANKMDGDRNILDFLKKTARELSGNQISDEIIELLNPHT